MSVGTKLAAFAALLALTFGAAFAVGAAVEVPETEPAPTHSDGEPMDQPTPEHTSDSSTNTEPHETDEQAP